MTWKEFKDRVEKAGIGDDDVICAIINDKKWSSSLLLKDMRDINIIPLKFVALNVGWDTEKDGKEKMVKWLKEARRIFKIKGESY